MTYRAGAHSTSDDPSKYRPKEEWAAWPLGDPIERLKRHLVGLGEWSDERHAALESELDETVRAANAEAQSHGVQGGAPHHDPRTMFEDVYKEMPWHLREQQEEMLRFR